MHQNTNLPWNGKEADNLLVLRLESSWRSFHDTTWFILDLGTQCTLLKVYFKGYHVCQQSGNLNSHLNFAKPQGYNNVCYAIWKHVLIITLNSKRNYTLCFLASTGSEQKMNTPSHMNNYVGPFFRTWIPFLCCPARWAASVLPHVLCCGTTYERGESLTTLQQSADTPPPPAVSSV